DAFLDSVRARVRHTLGRIPDGDNNVDVAGAATDVSRDPFADLLVVGSRIVFEQLERAQDHAGRTEPALQTMTLGERLLNRMEPTISADSFDRRDRRAVHLDGEGTARLNVASVQHDSAGPATSG